MAGKLRSPLHLSGGNEDELIKIFKDVKPQDWIFTTYRSHYHALLKGVPQDWLKQWVLDNKSIHVMNKEHKIVTSAIVGGTLSHAVGCAMAIKRKYWIRRGGQDINFKGNPHVWCFCGDMTASLGTFYDCARYALFNELPVTFVVENNGLSTDTPTAEAWGVKGCSTGESNEPIPQLPNMIIYNYKRTYPHYGVGKFVAF